MGSLIMFSPKNAESITLHIKDIDITYDLTKWICMHDTNNMQHMINMYKVHARNRYTKNYEANTYYCDCNKYDRNKYDRNYNCDCAKRILKSIEYWFTVTETDRGIYIVSRNFKSVVEMSGTPQELFNNFINKV